MPTVPSPPDRPVSAPGPRMRARLLAASAAGAAAVGVTGLADAAGEHDGVSRLDPVVAGRVLQVRAGDLTVLAQAFTAAGSEVVVGGLALVVLLVLVVRGRLARAATFALGMGGSVVLTVVLKLWVARARPPAVDRLGAFDPTWSFPSGHTLNSTVLLALLVWLLWAGASRGGRAGLVLLAAVLALGVAASRVYLGYHWTTDVVASFLVGLGWLSVVWLLRGPVERAVGRRARRATPAA